MDTLDAMAYRSLNISSPLSFTPLNTLSDPLFDTFFSYSDKTDVLPAQSTAIIKQTEMNWVIGMIFGSLCYGALLTVGLSCLKALRSLPRHGGSWNQRRVLMVHVSLLLLLNTVLQVKTFRQNLIAIFETPPESLTYFYLDMFNILVVAVLALTDGLLVWRCYMVQKVLLGGRPARWNHLCWIIPSVLWFIFLVAGITGVILSDPNRLLALEPEPFTLLLLLISILCNILLNTFATANIIIRLLLHRRKMIASFGRTSLLSNYHLGIVGILLESAIINVPLSIASVACALVVGGFGLMAWELGVPSQSFSSVLVIYQVATGKATGSELNMKDKMDSYQLDTVVYTTDEHT